MHIAYFQTEANTITMSIFAVMDFNYKQNKIKTTKQNHIIINIY